jgi:hypothetical protein
MSKLVYISHQVSGDVEKNIKSILKICKKIHTTDIIPFAPYLVVLQYLNDDISEERELGIESNREFFARKIIDELWLCGSKISSGMKWEIGLARDNKIPIHCYSISLKSELKKIIKLSS